VIMDRLIILCDLDDVLWDLLNPWIGRLNAMSGEKYCPKDITAWDISQFYPTLTKGVVYSPFREKTFWEKVHPMPHSREVVKKILEDGHKFKIVTSTHYNNATLKMTRFFELFPELSWKDLTITTDKQAVQGHFLIDDNPDNLIGGSYYKILFDRPHNKDFTELTTDWTRVRDLPTAYEVISAFTK